MKRYMLSDGDAFPEDNPNNDLDYEYDIEGEHYEALLEYVLRYCSYFSLNYRFIDTDPPMKELERFEFQRQPKADLIKKWSYFAEYFPEYTKFYLLTEESIAILKSISDSVFKFLTPQFSNPEDPTFYRSNDSVFFSSETHEGFCYLFPRDDEDVSELIKHREWHEVPINQIGYMGYRTEDAIPWSDN